MAKKITIGISVMLLVVGGGVALYLYKLDVAKEEEIRKERCRQEARFDHFMNYWYPFLEQYCKNVDVYVCMKKNIILDYVRTHKGRYIYENVPIYGGGYFSMRQYVDVESVFSRSWVCHGAALPITSVSNCRIREQMAFYDIFCTGRELYEFNPYEDELIENPDYIENSFNSLDSLAHEIYKKFFLLDRYRATQYKYSNINTLNNIPRSEYLLENY